jgi:hypothetical protein
MPCQDNTKTGIRDIQIPDNLSRSMDIRYRMYVRNYLQCNSTYSSHGKKCGSFLFSLFLNQKPKPDTIPTVSQSFIEIEISNHKSIMTSITRTEEQKALVDSWATGQLRVLRTQLIDILSGNCNLCSTYMDQQLEYEMTHNDNSRSSYGVMQVQSMLFDEDSVVESITSR